MLCLHHFDLLPFLSFSPRSLQTFKTSLILLMFVVPSDIMHDGYVFYVI